MQPALLAADADEYSVTRSLEAYLLWLFGYIMFNNTHNNSVDRILLPYAREIADGDEDVPHYNWGEAVLAGCPLLLQLWSYERLAVGRPIVSHEPYHGGMYGDEEDEKPTMGTIWIWRQVC